MTRTTHAGHARLALRDATMESHQRVDALFSRFSFADAAAYAAFLRAHARALPALEALARPDTVRLPLLARDLAALGQPLPPPLTLEEARDDSFRWGARYALEGSRLGGAMLARRVGEDLPRAYLSAVHDKGGWVAFQQALEEAADAGGEGWIEGAIDGAQAAFALFAQAADSEIATVHG